MEEWKGDEAEKQRRIAEWKGHSYKFSSYDPGVTRLYNERYPWIGARNLVVVCTKKTAMTLELAVLLESLMSTGKSKFTRKLKLLHSSVSRLSRSVPSHRGPCLCDAALSCLDQMRRRPSRALPRV